MQKNVRNIAIIFILLLGVLSNVFSIDSAENVLKISKDKCELKCEITHKWVNKANSPVSENALFALMKMDDVVLRHIDDLNDYDLFLNFTQDLSKNVPGFADFFNSVDRFKAWDKLFVNQAWRTHIPSLSKTSRYLENGLELETVGNKIIVKQNGVQLGELNKLDANDIYFPDQLMVKAQVNPGRHFDLDLAGGPIVRKTWDNPTITTQGISDIEIHVSRFGPSNANDVMISRLNQINNGEIPITDYDKRFYTHELEEYARYKNMGQPTGVPSNADEATKLWNDTHTASLESYSVNEINQPLYHPTAQ